MPANGDEKSARIAIKPDIAYFRLIWDEICEQYSDTDLDHRLRVYDIIMNAMNALAMSEGPYMGEVDMSSEEYGWVRDKKRKRK